MGSSSSAVTGVASALIVDNSERDAPSQHEQLRGKVVAAKAKVKVMGAIARVRERAEREAALKATMNEGGEGWYAAEAGSVAPLRGARSAGGGRAGGGRAGAGGGGRSRRGA